MAEGTSRPSAGITSKTSLDSGALTVVVELHFVDPAPGFTRDEQFKLSCQNWTESDVQISQAVLPFRCVNLCSSENVSSLYPVILEEPHVLCSVDVFV